MNPPPFLLVIDVGNTDSKIGLFDRQGLVHTWRVRTDRHRTPDEYEITMTQLFLRANVDVTVIRDIVIASVVPVVNPTACRSVFLALRLEPRFSDRRNKR